MRIDHAIIGARDIETVADRLWERHGLASLPGGRHAGWGTHNRIVPLGGPYLEIIGVVDENEALRDPMGRWLIANTATGDPLMGWCCETADIERLSRRLGLALERGGRERPDGSRLSWRVAGRDAALGARPFFIAWDEPDMRPGLLERSARRRVARHQPRRGRLQRRGAGRLGRGRCPGAPAGHRGRPLRDRDRDRERGDPPDRRFMKLG